MTTDLDAFLLGANGQLLEQDGLVASLGDNVGEGAPLEVVQWENDSGFDQTVQLVINRYSGASPRLKFILLQNGRRGERDRVPRIARRRHRRPDGRRP